jgi:uncharacterized Tic20 family protein
MSAYVSSSPLVTLPNERERLAALLAHGGTLFAWFLAPLAIYLLKRGESRWVEHQALQSLLWSLSGTALALLTCGLAAPVFLVWHVVATVKILRGQDYDYPIVGDFSRGLVGMPSSVAPPIVDSY